MKVLFFMLHTGYARNFEFPIRVLAERGHHIHVACDREKKLSIAGSDPLEPLVEAFATVSTGPSPKNEDKTSSTEAGRRLRVLADYFRYLDPEFVTAPALRARAGRRVPSGVRQAANLRIARTLGLLDRTREAVARADDGLPVNPRIREFIAAQNPDVVLVTPLVEIGSPQTEYVRAARDLGIPSCLCVASWDNLTNKGLIHLAPDLTMVWNAAQHREAVELHGVAPESVAVTGAVPYDHWFDWSAKRDRAEFCERVGLDPQRPFILYVGSSGFIAPGESRHVADWARAIRWAQPELSGVQILVRPHPTNPMRADPEAAARLDSIDDLVVYPPGGANPTDAESRADYFNSIWHASVVTGVNTTAFLESAIIDRPVHVLLVPKYYDTQQGTLHFRHLLPENGGMLNVGSTIEEHARGLVTTLEDASSNSANRDFVSHFIRPKGLDEPVAPRVADLIEELAAAGVAEEARPGERNSGHLARIEGWALAQAMRTYLRQRTARDRAAKRRVQQEKAKAKARKAKPAKAKKPPKKSERPGKPSPKGKEAQEKLRPEAKPPRKLKKGKKPKKRKKGRAKVPITKASNAEVALQAMERDQQRVLASVREKVEPMAAGDGPIIAGPFLGEVGFEVLYWIPFLRWVLAEYPDLEGRLVIVGRGGPRNWYSGISDRYTDALSLYSPEEFTERRDGIKQREITDLDREIYESAAKRFDLDKYDVIHPGMMFHLYYKNLKLDSRAFARAVEVDGDRAGGLAARYTRYPLPELGELEQLLPDDFVAVRFYSRPSLPATTENENSIRNIIASIAENTNVVLLNNGMELDDHRDFGVEGAITLAEHMRPENNLEIQSIAISRARAFVGTYGGLAYVAPHYGVPSLTFLADPNEPMPWHLELAQRVFGAPGWGSVTVTPLEQLSVLQLVGSGNGRVPAIEGVTA